MEYDNIIGAVLILLILSLITEKISNFLKLHSVSLSTPQSSLVYETSRTKAIQKRTIVIGVIVAILCKASLFMIFKPDTVFFWTEKELSFFDEGFDLLGFFATIFGSFLTGFFLSFGSKFFHDLLDLLLEAKNLKRKLAERADWDFDTIEEVDKYILTNDSAEARAKIRDELAKFPGIEYYKVDYSKRLVYVFGNGKQEITTQLNIQGSLGIATFKIVVLKEKVKEIKALTLIKPSIEIANATPFRKTLLGTTGLIVQDIDSNEKYILTCYHAVWNSDLNMKWSGFANESDCNITSPINGEVIGSLYIGIKNYKLDIALIKPQPGISLTNEMPANKKPKAVRTLTEDDVKGGTRLSILSRNSPASYNFGTCANVNCTASITYPDKEKRSLEKLYQIESLQKNPFSIGGDSGSVVLDEFDYAVGILVAGDEKTTSFAIPIESILSSYNLKLFI